MITIEARALRQAPSLVERLRAHGTKDTEEEDMSQEFTQGDRVTWKSHGGDAEGEGAAQDHGVAFHSASVAWSPHQMCLMRRPSY